MSILMLRCWQRTICQDECLLVFLYARGCQDNFYEKLG